MTDISVINLKGVDYNLADTAGRDNTAKAAREAEYDRQYSTGTYAGRDLASVFASEIKAKGNDPWAWLQSRAKAGNYDGIRIGDYLQVTTTGSNDVTAQTNRMLVAGLDTYYQVGDNGNRLGHHVLMIPQDCWKAKGTHAKGAQTDCLMWNLTNTDQGTSTEKHPYLASNLHQWETECLLPALPQACRNVLLTHRMLLEERYSGSGSLNDSTNYSWADLGKVWSPSETEVFGQCVWGTNGWSVGADRPLPLFENHVKNANQRADFWLRSVASSSSTIVCYRSGYGSASRNVATHSWVHARSGFLVG